MLWFAAFSRIGADGTYFDYDDMEAHVMQRLATTRYFHEREMQRYPGLNASQVIDSSSAANTSLTLPIYGFTKFLSWVIA
ncbi:hypothetical protein WN943_025839 [Citrus x changshan-huyou]